VKKFVFCILACLAYGMLPCHAANVIEPAMVTIPAGEFVMGTDNEPAGGGPHNPIEMPMHKVHVTAFRMAMYTTTVEQFREFVKATGYKTSDQCWKWTHPGPNDDFYMTVTSGNWHTPAYAPSPFHPVVCVSWTDAQAYVTWLSKKTGRHFRLPSEAEWEYAARAGTSTRYPFGDDPAGLCEFANVLDRTGKAAFQRDYGVDWTAIACDDGAEFTTVVGSYAPNAWGLYDMLGNVGQWTADCEHPDYVGAPTDGSAWTSNCAENGEMYITRGGNYASGPISTRPTTRAHAGKTNRSSLGEGFRIAEDVGNEDDKSCGGHGECTPNAATKQFLAGLAKAQSTEQSRRQKARQTSS
jgi:formylglycine-generating enzyme required for sulfatase activity